MLNRRYTAVILSLAVHGILLLLLFTMTPPLPQPAPATRPAIKSYLYTPQKKSAAKTPAAPDSPPKPIEKQAPIKELPPATSKAKENSPEKIPANSKQTPPELAVEKQQTTAPVTLPATAIKDPGKETKAPKKFSARSQLDKLKNAINNRMIQEEVYQYQQHRSASIMHGAQEPVPHSKKAVDAIQKKADSTTQYSQGMSITKNDDGTCSVTEDLSNVGMAGLSATQSFSCGESKEEKYFREHMKNVLKKLGK